MSLEAELDTQVKRLVVLWPALRNKPEVLSEVKSAVLRHTHRLVSEDIRMGMDDVIANCPTTGWPPGPHEVLGCILARQKARATQAPTRSLRKFGGVTFKEWWMSLPLDERDQHATLARMLGVGLPSVDEAAGTPAPVPVTCKPAAGTPLGGDVIQWEVA